LIKYFLE